MEISKNPLMLGPLPYEYDALEPVLSAKAMKIHYEGHHAGYVRKFNKLLREGGSSEDLEFNYSAHILHTMFWNNLAPPNTTYPGKLLSDTYDPEILVHDLTTYSSKIRGVGWTLLIKNRRNNLVIKNISNHDLYKVIGNHKPLLILDIWEHVWVYDYPANRKLFLKNLISIINWDKIEQRLTH